MLVETHNGAPLKLMNIFVYKVYVSKLIKEKKIQKKVKTPFGLKRDRYNSWKLKVGIYVI